MKVILNSDTNSYMTDFVPTSVYLNGIQTYDYYVKDLTIYFATTILAGTEITLIPENAIRFNDEIFAVFTPDVLGAYSILSEPFGKIQFSLDQQTWHNVLTTTLPENIYAKYVPDGFSYKCDASAEILLWQGPSMQINDLGEIVSQTEVTYYAI